MNKKLFTQIRNEWRSNLWLALELLVVSVVMWYIIDLLYCRKCASWWSACAAAPRWKRSACRKIPILIMVATALRKWITTRFMRPAGPSAAL